MRVLSRLSGIVFSGIKIGRNFGCFGLSGWCFGWFLCWPEIGHLRCGYRQQRMRVGGETYLSFLFLADIF